MTESQKIASAFYTGKKVDYTQYVNFKIGMPIKGKKIKVLFKEALADNLESAQMAFSGMGMTENVFAQIETLLHEKGSILLMKQYIENKL